VTDLSRVLTLLFSSLLNAVNGNLFLFSVCCLRSLVLKAGGSFDMYVEERLKNKKKDPPNKTLSSHK
jgi:hypothetical protein